MTRPTAAILQREPKEGAAPSFPTEVRVAYDATAIYVAVEARDAEPARLVGLLTRRDSHSPSDWIRVAIDSYYDRRTAFEFAVNPAGVKQDTYYFNDGNQDTSYDAVWDVAVSKHAQGWRAEFRIPFSQLRFGKSATGPLGMAVIRQIGRLNETSTWPLIAKSGTGFVSQFGDLTGVVLSRAPKRLELMPYAVSQVATRPNADANPLVSSPDPDASMGVDLKYALAAVAPRPSDEVPAQLPHQLQPVGRLELRRRSAVRRRQHQRPRGVRQQLELRHGRERRGSRVQPPNRSCRPATTRASRSW